MDIEEASPSPSPSSPPSPSLPPLDAVSWAVAVAESNVFSASPPAVADSSAGATCTAEAVSVVVATSSSTTAPRALPASVSSRKRSILSSSSTSSSSSSSGGSPSSIDCGPPRKKRSVTWGDFHCVQLGDQYFDLAKRFTCPQLHEEAVCFAADLCSQHNVLIRKVAWGDGGGEGGAGGVSSVLRHLVLSRVLPLQGIRGVEGAYEHGGALYIVTRAMDGVLEDVVGDPITFTAIAKIVKQLLRALVALHAEGLSHGNICAVHVDVDADGTTGLRGYGVAPGDREEETEGEGEEEEEGGRGGAGEDLRQLGCLMQTLLETLVTIGDEANEEEKARMELARHLIARLLDGEEDDEATLLEHPFFFGTQLPDEEKRPEGSISAGDWALLSLEGEDEVREAVRAELRRFDTVSASFDYHMWSK